MAEPMDKGTLVSIVQLWPDFVLGNYLRLDIKEVTVPLLQFLNQLGVQAEQLHVLLQPCKKQSGRLQHLSNEIEECFTAIWNAQPNYYVDDIDHDSRPDAYLQWPTELGKVASRSVDVRGFISILFCTSIFGHLTSEGNYGAA
jgi:hypothetical protein